MSLCEAGIPNPSNARSNDVKSRLYLHAIKAEDQWRFAFVSEFSQIVSLRHRADENTVFYIRIRGDHPNYRYIQYMPLTKRKERHKPTLPLKYRPYLVLQVPRKTPMKWCFIAPNTMFLETPPITALGHPVVICLRCVCIIIRISGGPSGHLF